jgi:hypothetical protein
MSGSLTHVDDRIFPLRAARQGVALLRIGDAAAVRAKLGVAMLTLAFFSAGGRQNCTEDWAATIRPNSDYSPR